MIPGILWPPLPPDARGILTAMRATESLSPNEVAAGQLRQLQALAQHTREQTQWGRRHLPEQLGWNEFRALPVLDRRYIQERHQDLVARWYPPEHGESLEYSTSGSTGMPVRVHKTELARMIWLAVTARDHLWHQRDLSLTLAAIRRIPDAPYPGVNCPSWGEATDMLGGSGPSRLLDISEPVPRQLEWLDEHADFGYLLTYPSNLSELLRLCADQPRRWPTLRQVRTVSEPVTDELRDQCQEVLGVEIIDLYSSQELGYLALQRPGQPGFYPLSDNHVVEVLDDDGNACRPGEVGRVVVTPLHNFAMPLFRYDVGDLALVGEPAALPYPVIDRVFGRTRNLLLAPDGTRRWANLGIKKLQAIVPVIQHQFIQVSRDHIVARLVVPRPVTPAEEQSMAEQLASRTPGGIRYTFDYVERIPRGPGGKFEDFICEAL